MFYPLRYLDEADVHAAHAPTAVYEKYKLPLGFPEVWLDGSQVRAEIQHDHRVVRDVLVQTFPDDFRLQQARKELGRESTRAVDSHASSV